MASTNIRLRRGNKTNLPSSAASGTPLWCEDTKELYIGTDNGVAKVGVNDLTNAVDNTNVLNPVGVKSGSLTELKRNTSVSIQGNKITATTFQGALTGNASTATKLQTARTIALSGDVTASGTFDGSGNLTLSAKILDGYKALNSSYCFKSGNLNGQGNADLISFSGATVAYKVGGSYPELKGVLADGTPFTLSSLASHSVASLANGTYNKFVGSDGSSELFANNIYKQKTTPIGRTSNTNIATSANAISSGIYNSSYPMSNAFNNNSSNFWGCSQLGTNIPNVAYLGQKNVAKRIGKVKIWQYSASNYATTLAFQFSNDGTNWININTVTNGVYGVLQEFDVNPYNPSGTTHYFRVLAKDFKGGGSNNWCINILQLYSREDINTNDIWIKTTNENMQVKKYNGSSWVDYTKIPLGSITVTSNAVTSVSTFPFLNKTLTEASDAHPAQIVETYRNGTSGYYIRSDGWCVQWGYHISAATITSSIKLLKPYIDTSFLVFRNSNSNNLTTNATANYYDQGCSSKTVNSFTFSSNAYASTYAWMTCGYIR